MHACMNIVTAAVNKLCTLQRHTPHDYCMQCIYTVYLQLPQATEKCSQYFVVVFHLKDHTGGFTLTTNSVCLRFMLTIFQRI